MASPYTYFPATYSNNFNQYQQAYPPQQMAQIQQQMQPIQQAQPVQQAMNPQIQMSGIVSVPSEKEVDEYPVAPGNCVTFRLENSPYLITKTKTYSPLEQAHKKYYKLIEEETAKTPENKPNNIKDNEPLDLTIYATKDDLGAILERLEALESEKAQKKAAVKKKEVQEDE